jgi:hypothetical protein
MFSLGGGFNHLEKYESQWEGLSHILWKIKHVPKPPTRISSNITRISESLTTFTHQKIQKCNQNVAIKHQWTPSSLGM